MTTLADTSAWVEYLRATGSPAHLRLRRLIADGDDLVTTEVVVMELLAGASNDELARLGRLLGRFELLPVQGLADFEAAAGLYRRCRRAGETVRKLTDCLIAVVAMRAGAALLHRDQDFEAIARHAPLRVAD
ncbi:MAG TPA: PIN domain nuclease [Actinomycetes bacterium]|nr:PIN domain nuclease [Actinomycetes bacterium]